MIKKSIDKITATEKQKKDIYERLCADYEKSEKTEKKTKNNFLKYGAMAAATVLVLGAVAAVVSIIINMQGVPVTHPESGTLSQSTSGSTVEPECDPEYPASALPPELVVDTKPVFMAWYKPGDDFSIIENYFREMYGIPENKPEGFNSAEDSDVICSVTTVRYSDRYSELVKLISAGNSPDIFPYESIYPYTIYKGLFQSVDDIVDFSGPWWDVHNKYTENLKWQGKTYAPIISVDAAQYLWYRKSVIEENGFDDPYTLYKQGKWDYDAFFSMVSEFTDSKKEKYGIDGYPYMIDSFIATTGKTFFTIENGKLVSNLYDSDIINTMDMLSSRLNDIENKYNSDDQLRYPNEGLNNWNPSYRSWIDGNTLFFADGQWIYDDQWIKYKELKKWDDDEVQFVPYPDYDNADGYYYNASVNSYMLCSGSKNIEGYAAFMYSAAVTEYDYSWDYVRREKLKENYGWTDELLDHIEETTNYSFNTPVFSFKDSIEKATTPDVGHYDPVISDLTRMPFCGEKSFTEVRDKWIKFINEWLEELNKEMQ